MRFYKLVVFPRAVSCELKQTNVPGHPTNRKEAVAQLVARATKAGLTVVETKYGGLIIYGAKSAQTLTKMAAYLANNSQYGGHGDYYIEVDKGPEPTIEKTFTEILHDWRATAS